MKPEQQDARMLIKHIKQAPDDWYRTEHLIMRALLTARQEGRKEAFEEVKSVVREYVWDDHALAQATDIGRAVHHQSVEILEAVSKAGEA